MKSFESSIPEEKLVHQKETSAKKIIYSEDFKTFVQEHPGVISTFKKIESAIEGVVVTGDLSTGNSLSEGIHVGDVFEEDEVRATVLDVTPSDINPKKKLGVYLKMEIGSEAFFVKRIPGFFDHEIGLGGNEFVSIKTAAEILKDVEGVEVVLPILGYHEYEGKTSYFISRWVDGVIKIDEYMKSLRNIKNKDKEVEERIKYVYDKVNLIGRMLINFNDVGWNNTLYCTPTGKIVIFDVHLKEIPGKKDKDAITKAYKGI